MCGRFSSVTIEEVADILGEVQRDLDARADAWTVEADGLDASDVRPGSPATALIPGSDLLSPAELTWGLAANWTSGKLLFNTRIEKAAGANGMWPPIAERRRCLVPATRFWERSREGRQVAFADGAEGLVMMAGVFLDDRLSVVTAEPAPEVARFHDRMPLCLTPATAATWLSPAWRELAHAGCSAAIVPEQPRGPVQMSLF